MTLRLLLSIVVVSQALSGEILPGAYSGFERTGNSFRVHAGTCEIRITFYTPAVARIDFTPFPGTRTDSSMIVIRHPDPGIPVDVRETGASLTFASSHLRIHCAKFPLRVSIADSSGRVLLAEPDEGGMAAVNDERRLRFRLGPKEHFYGTGERGTGLDKRGQAFECYNTQVGGYSTPIATMNINVPFLCSSNGYALLVDNIHRGRFDLGATDGSRSSYTAEGGELTWYVIQGATIPEQLERYTWLTGCQPLPPRWAFGYIQSKNRYRDEAEARAIVKTIRAEMVPCDAIVLDLAWFRHMGDVSWDLSRWPQHESMVSEFAAAGIKTILITEPYIVQPSRNFMEADSLGYLAKDHEGRTYLLENWWSCRGCNAALIDLTNPGAQRWWWNKHPEAFGKDVAGIWTDLGEPERHPEGMRHFGGSAQAVHNTFNLHWAKTLYEGFLNLRPGARVLNLTRSGFAGIQRYGVLTWSGDVARSFGGLQAQLPMILTMGMSGLAYHHSDIGGYARMTTTPELYVRWMEFGVFSPIARAHGAGESVGGSPTEPWQFGPRAKELCRDLLRLRYRLLPYTYTLAHENSMTGMPIARPLFFLDTSDARLADESSSYLWGDALLVSPVVTPGETSKTLYLPRGRWFNFWTDEAFFGRKMIRVDAPLGRVPLFVREGSIIPMAPDMDFSDQRALDTLTLVIYPADTAESSFTLYEDDGKTLDHQTGASASTGFTMRWTTPKRTLRIVAGAARGTYTGSLARRSYLFDIHDIGMPPVAVRCNGVAVPRRENSTAGGSQGYLYDAGARRLSFHIPARMDSTYNIDVRFR
jgi:alpha-glucosidase (family GH31 glycosyl hydrolase)